MPRPRKHPKRTRSVNHSYKKIQPKPLNSAITSKAWNNRDMVRQDKRSDVLGSVGQAAFGAPTAPSSINTDLYGMGANSFVENPAGNGSVPGGSGPFGNGSNITSLLNQGLFPVGHPSNPLSPAQTGGVGPEGAIETAPNVSSTRPSGYGIYAVGVRTDSGTEPLCAVFNSQTETSCMLARVADRLPNVLIRPTTPAQRRRWYSTPAGQLYDPQRYAELYLKAFDPYIPPVRLTILLLEGDGPIDGVHIYLGRAVFTKLEGQQIPLQVQETVDFAWQNIGFGAAMNWAMGQHGNNGMPGFPGPAPAAYNGGIGPSNRSNFGPPSLTSVGASSFSYYDFTDTMSAKISLFSDPLWCTPTISSLDSTIAPSNTMIELMKNPADDVFDGHARLESVGHDGDLDSDTINTTTSSNSSLVLWNGRL